MLKNTRPIRQMSFNAHLKNNSITHIRNVSDESVVEQWSENAYYQFFSGQESFVAAALCEASELVHFRERIGEAGIEPIFKESIRMNGKDADEDSGAIISRTSFTPDETALSWKNSDYVVSAITCAREVFPLPGGPQKIIEGTFIIFKKAGQRDRKSVV